MQNLKWVQERTWTKGDATSFLQDLGILHKNRQCTKGHEMTLCLAEKNDRWRCSRRSCREEVWLKSGTWLQGTKLPFQKVCEFIYCWAHEMTNVEFCRRELGIMSSETIVDWNYYLREVCAEKLMMDQLSIGGIGLHVEIDESLFVRRKYNVGRAVRQQWVFGGICRETGECFLYAVEDRSSATLLSIIEEKILPGTTIISDEWRGYHHRRDPQSRVQTPSRQPQSAFCRSNYWCMHERSGESMGNAKARNKRHWGTHTGMIESYLCEFMWRQRCGAYDPFSRILSDIALVNQLP
jgi:transposase-like protein